MQAFGRCLLMACLAIALLRPAHAQDTPAPAQTGIELLGDFPSPKHLSDADIQALPHTEIHTKDMHDGGKDVDYTGVLMTDILKAGGFTFGSGMAASRETVRTLLIAEAADGYKVVYALAELDPSFTDRLMYLADAKDGKPLPAGEGKYRIVFPGDKRPARWARQVISLTLKRE